MTDVRTSLLPFYVTFGVQYAHKEHPYWPGADPAGWVRVMAKTLNQAMTLAHAYFGEHYAFCYPADKFDTDEDRKYYPHGELAVIELGNLAVEGDGPKPIVSISESTLHGVAPGTTICARIEGELIGRPNPEADDVELFHRTCVEQGKALFQQVFNVDTNVMAYELDWATTIECPVCHTSIIN